MCGEVARQTLWGFRGCECEYNFCGPAWSSRVSRPSTMLGVAPGYTVQSRFVDHANFMTRGSAAPGQARRRIISTDGPVLDDLDLPPALLEAPRRYTTCARRQLLKEQVASTPISPLYHCTRDVSFRGIISGETFWCFSHEQQTDPNEFEYSLRVARETILEVGRSDDPIVQHFCACLDDLLETNDLSGPFQFYLTSFSRHRDHGPQWKLYGDNGRGFAVGLGPSLFQADIDTLFPEANRNLHVGRVVYGDAATRRRHHSVIAKAAKITSLVGRANGGLVRVAGPARYLVTMAREVLAQQLVWNCLTAKEEKFSDEREVRGVIMNVKANFDSHRKDFAGRSYVEHKLDLKRAGAIAEILVGPLAASNAGRRSAQHSARPRIPSRHFGPPIHEHDLNGSARRGFDRSHLAMLHAAALELRGWQAPFCSAPETDGGKMALKPALPP
jgi:hypothetical protein